MDSSSQILEFRRSDRVIRSGFCLAQTVLPENPAIAQQEISSLEWDRSSAFQNDRARNAFLLGRRCAKRALTLLESNLDLKSISLLSGVAGNPILQGVFNPYEASISHSLDYAVAITSPAQHPVTLDLERIRPDRVEAIERMLTSHEIEMIQASSDPVSTSTLIWTAKEALSKWLRSGMSLHFKVLEVKSIQKEGDRISGSFSHVFHLRFESWQVGPWWLTIVFPNKSQFKGFEPETLQKLKS
ncbi:MAG: 4'-phosphopantetheinyl transferase superfamily protein [Verrucomicrobiota bacterium]